LNAVFSNYYELLILKNLNLLPNSNSKARKPNLFTKNKICTIPASVFYLPHNQNLLGCRNPLASEVVGRKRKKEKKKHGHG